MFKRRLTIYILPPSYYSLNKFSVRTKIEKKKLKTHSKSNDRKSINEKQQQQQR